MEKCVGYYLVGSVAGERSHHRLDSAGSLVEVGFGGRRVVVGHFELGLSFDMEYI